MCTALLMIVVATLVASNAAAKMAQILYEPVAGGGSPSKLRAKR